MATEICLCYDLKDRIRILTKFIELARVTLLFLFYLFFFLKKNN